MNIKAIWIIDDKYVLPAYLSVSSFIQIVNIPVVVVFCGDVGVKEANTLFTSLSELIEFEIYEAPLVFQNDPRKAIITNRLARMYYAQKIKEGVVLLLDADTLFTDQSNALIQAIKDDFNHGVSTIFGVLDAQVAYRDYLYFRTVDDKGRDIVTPHLEQKDIYHDVFGQNWWHHLKGASINNGVVAFYDCDEVVESWRTYYLKGLSHHNVNPGDDQLPLAAAIHSSNQNVVCLPEKFNSKGKVSGDFTVYHALSSIWKMQIYSAYSKEFGVSDFADLAKQFLPSVPEHILSAYFDVYTGKSPYLFRKLDGKFGFQHLYRDICSGINKGTVVEIGMGSGKSTCYMVELIKNSRKDIRFVTYSDSSDPNEGREEFYALIDRFDLDQYVEIVKYSDGLPLYDIKENAEFVFLNLGNDYDQLLGNLEYWYAHLNPGGILAGYDYTSQIGLNYGNKCATYDFCIKKNLSLSISFNIFIIKKPNVDISLVEEEEQSLVMHDSNLGL